MLARGINVKAIKLILMKKHGFLESKRFILKSIMDPRVNQKGRGPFSFYCAFTRFSIQKRQFRFTSLESLQDVSKFSFPEFPTFDLLSAYGLKTETNNIFPNNFSFAIFLLKWAQILLEKVLKSSVWKHQIKNLHKISSFGPQFIFHRNYFFPFAFV